MSELAQTGVVMDDFPGLTTIDDPRDLSPGQALELVNLDCSNPGQLQLRPGLKPVTFEN